jgi:hypothetical protein
LRCLFSFSVRSGSSCAGNKQDQVSGSALAVHAAILAATANLKNAKTEAAQLKREQLLPEEQALVESLPGS